MSPPVPATGCAGVGEPQPALRREPRAATAANGSSSEVRRERRQATAQPPTSAAIAPEPPTVTIGSSGANATNAAPDASAPVR